MKLSKLIQALQEVKRTAGDKEILISADPEGNSYGALGEVLEFCDEKEQGRIVIFPVSEVRPD